MMSPLLGILLALGVIFIYQAQSSQHLSDITMQPMQNDAANQIAVMTAGTQSYMSNSWATLVGPVPSGGIPVGGVIAVTPPKIASVVPSMAGFVDGNVFGQKHVALIGQPTAGTLEAFVMTYGGDSIADQTLIRVANAGPPGSVVILSNDTTNFEGAAGGVVEATAPFTVAGYALTAGHLGAHIEQTTYQAHSPYVARYWTGNAEDATMHQDLVMNGNNIQSAKTVTATQQVTTPILADPGGVNQVIPAGTSTVVSVTASGTVKASIYSY